MVPIHCRIVLLLPAFLSCIVSAQDAQTINVWPNKAQLNNVVNIEIDHVDSFVKPDASEKAPSYVPFLGDIPLKGSRLESFDQKTGVFRFTLLRGNDAASRDSWNQVLGNLGAMTRSNPAPRLSVGRDGIGPLPSSFSEFSFVVFPEPQSAIGLLLAAIMIVCLLALAVRTDILKDPAPAAGGRATWSMGRCQMAWWMVIVLASFLVIWLVTGDLTFPASSLILLGISGATALGAKLITPESPAAKQPMANSGFLRELLYENGQPALHRFQVFVWTILLGVIFAFNVINNLAQPTFDSTLMTLMGISSGAYVGFKFT